MVQLVHSGYPSAIGFIARLLRSCFDYKVLSTGECFAVISSCPDDGDRVPLHAWFTLTLFTYGLAILTALSDPASGALGETIVRSIVGDISYNMAKFTIPDDTGYRPLAAEKGRRLHTMFC